ncbi:HAAS signaling domain-containing protein [Phycicoccus avicenniae]|uniref:HAAS signaling domain-containing protein n=1 Tax=Phycicoccus avicenniae TaxID=2828860 RepID=UPI003D291AF1
MNSSDTRVSAYLDDLARMLSDLAPEDRDEVLAGVREHLEATLAEHPDDPAAVDAALLRLGPPERVAAEARADQPAEGARVVEHRFVPAPVRPTPGLIRAGALLVAGATGLLLALEVLARVTALGQGPGMFGPSEAIFLGVFLLGPFWLAGTVCTAAARGLTGRTRAALLLAGPVAVLVVLATTFWQEPPVLSAIVSVALCLLTGVGLAGAARRAWRESHAG